jgi:NADPH2:quinone reductase
MRAAVVTRFGGPEVFELAELPDPVPGPGQVAIDVTYAAVGLIDIYIRRGVYKNRAGLPQPPYVPGWRWLAPSARWAKGWPVSWSASRW